MCDFCKIINNELSAHIVHKSEHTVIFLDMDPIHEGHVLIVPKIHCDTIDELSDDVILDIIRVTKKIVEAYKEVYGNEGYSIIQNGGKFCDYGHAHFHVFPRYDNDGFSWNYPNEKSEYSEMVAAKLREKLL